LLLLLFFFFFAIDLVQVSLQTRSFAARFLKLLLRLPILFNSGSGFVERSFHWRGIFSLV
jgi:predicted membrane protein